MTLPVPGSDSRTASTFILPTISSDSALDEQLLQGDSTALQMVLDLGALAARPGRLLERRLALLGREARRLGHGRLR